MICTIIFKFKLISFFIDFLRIINLKLQFHSGYDIILLGDKHEEKTDSNSRWWS